MGHGCKFIGRIIPSTTMGHGCKFIGRIIRVRRCNGSRMQIYRADYSEYGDTMGHGCKFIGRIIPNTTMGRTDAELIRRIIPSTTMGDGYKLIESIIQSMNPYLTRGRPWIRNIYIDFMQIVEYDRIKLILLADKKL